MIENEFVTYNMYDVLDDYTLDATNMLTHKSSETENQIDQITRMYFSKENLNNELIKKLCNDQTFKIVLLKNIKKRMKNIISDSSTLQFKELVSIVNLLSFGKDYGIFSKYNEFSSKGISDIFRFYEKRLLEEFQNKDEEFELTFEFYITLLDSFNELCIINSSDIKRKKNIKKIIELMTESINLIKFSILLKEEKIEKLSSFQGRLLLLFSNINYISTKDKNRSEIIYTYKFIFNQLIDGYYLIAGDDNFDSPHFPTLLSNVTNLLLLMIKKLQQYSDDYFNDLIEIIEVYNKYCQKENKEYTSVLEFKKDLLQNLVYLYDPNLKMSYTDLLEIILNKPILLHSDIIILHELILFLNAINKNQALILLDKLLRVKRVKNDYYEDYKLKVIDLILNSLIKKRELNDIEKYIYQITSYLNSENTASHLISSFSKIHLTIALYYSFLGPKYLVNSQREYFISEKICVYTLIKDEYMEIYEELLINNASTYLNKNSLKNKFSKEEMIVYGQSLMSDFFKNEEILIRYEVNENISNIIENILINDEYNKHSLEEKITMMISSEIFFGLCQCKIMKKTSSSSSLNEVGYEELEQDLLNDYVLVYHYSYSYNDTFWAIYEKNESYIKSNIVHLLLSYTMKKKEKKYISSYTDEDEDLSFY